MNPEYITGIVGALIAAAIPVAGVFAAAMAKRGLSGIWISLLPKLPSILIPFVKVLAPAVIIALLIGTMSLLAVLGYKIQIAWNQSDLPPPPILPPYFSPEVQGGYDPQYFCSPQRDVYARQYPDYDIQMRFMPEESHKDMFGHVRYRYSCAFTASRKPH